MEIDVRDKVIQEVSPTIMVPRYSNLEFLSETRHRFLVANDGLWIEAKSPWIHLVLPISNFQKFNLPYGVLKRVLKFRFDKIPFVFLDTFALDSQKSLPTEHTAWILWDQKKEKLVYRDLKILESGEGRVNFERPVLEEHESLVADLHSHGNLSSFFSQQDDEDDRGELKIAGVLGRVGTNKQKWSFRLCAGGTFFQLPQRICCFDC